METTTETSQNNRELTKTEIKIAIAQIEDRLDRWIKAAHIVRNSWESGDEAEITEEHARQKYDIPYGVCLFPLEAAWDCDKELFMKFAKWWLKGELDENSFNLFTFHFGEIVEVEYFWVLMDQPGYWYPKRWQKPDSEPNFNDLEPELKRIGTRSKKKQKIKFKLPTGHGPEIYD